MRTPQTPTGTELTTRGEAKPRPVGLTSMDYFRARIWVQKLDEGMEDDQAWAETLTHPTYGMRAFRGKTSVPPNVVARTLGRFIRRAFPRQSELARARVGYTAALRAGRMLDTVSKIADGDFGDAKVRTGRDGVEQLEIDAAAANTKIAAAKLVLGMAGMGVGSRDGPGTTVNVNQQQAVGVDFGTALRQLAEDGDRATSS